MIFNLFVSNDYCKICDSSFGISRTIYSVRAIFGHFLSENSEKHRCLASALLGPAPTGPLPHQATPHLNLICCITQCGLYMYCDLFTNIFNAVFLCTVNFFRVNFFHCGLFLLCTFSRHTVF